MWIWFWMVVCLVMGIGGASTDEKDHNKKEHDMLCEVLRAAVTLYTSSQSGDKLKKALGRAIFGNWSGDIETLKQDLPEEFKNPGNRENWCGSCTYGGDHYPGKSIPHDLICMCTVGSGGFPFLHHYKGTPTLCGKGAKDFGCEGQQEKNNGCHENNKHWWNESGTNHEPNGNGEVSKHLNATWYAVVKTCVGKDLRLEVGEARETLLKKLDVGGYSTPTWAHGHTGCTGGNSNVCVSYASWCHDDPKFPQWWKTLYKALKTSEDTRAQGNLTGVSRKRTRRDTGGAPTAGDPGDDSTEDEPENTGSASNNNHNHPLPLLSGQQSDTSLTQPLRLLSAAFLM